jgi:hypothetical protein
MRHALNTGEVRLFQYYGRRYYYELVGTGNDGDWENPDLTGFILYVYPISTALSENPFIEENIPANRICGKVRCKNNGGLEIDDYYGIDQLGGRAIAAWEQFIEGRDNELYKAA